MPRTVSFHEPLACEPAAVFRTQREMKLGFITLHDVSPIQLHAVVFGLFASVVAPFGGFLASAIKRAYEVKDFDSYRASRGIHNGFFSLRGTSPHTVLVDDLASDNILQGCMWAWKIPQARDYTISVFVAEEETLSSSSSPALASTSSEGQHSRSLLLR